ncbi:MAG: cysteine-rich CWC family protein [Acidobacteriota bacterium]
MSGSSVCESCGKEFSCGASLSGCWCSELKLSDETRAQLQSRYNSCLCRECLKRLSEPPAVAGG